MPVRWQAPHDVKDLSPRLFDWLLNTGSLTERLQALTNAFHVTLLGQEEMPMDACEHEMLCSSKHKAWQIREVLLQGLPVAGQEITKKNNDKPQAQLQDWVFARSVLPNELCHSQWANLGNQPLGSRIFNDDNFVRSEFQIGKLRYHPLTLKVFSPEHTCWARRSKFMIEDYELLVAEAFLPNSPCYW
jgi:chorismate--pyruvate lyase